MGGLFSRLFRGSLGDQTGPSKEWHLWPGKVHSLLIEDYELEKIIRAEAVDPFYLKVVAVQDSIQVFYGSERLGVMGDTSVYYINGLRTLQRSGRSGLALGGIYRSKKHGDSIYIDIGMANVGFIPFNQPSPRFTPLSKVDERHPLVECKDEHKNLLNIRQFARENWSAPGWFVVNDASGNYEVFTYSSKSDRLLTVGFINKKGQRVVDGWDFQSSEELLVKGFVTWDEATPQVILSADGW